MQNNCTEYSHESDPLIEYSHYRLKYALFFTIIQMSVFWGHWLEGLKLIWMDKTLLVAIISNGICKHSIRLQSVRLAACVANFPNRIVLIGCNVCVNFDKPLKLKCEFRTHLLSYFRIEYYWPFTDSVLCTDIQHHYANERTQVYSWILHPLLCVQNCYLVSVAFEYLALAFGSLHFNLIEWDGLCLVTFTFSFQSTVTHHLSRIRFSI